MYRHVTCRYVVEALAAAIAYHKLNKRKQVQLDTHARQKRPDAPLNGLKAAKNEKKGSKQNNLLVCENYN